MIIKLDFPKAFVSLSWESLSLSYALVVSKNGSTQGFRTSSQPVTDALLNGVPRGQEIGSHARMIYDKGTPFPLRLHHLTTAHPAKSQLRQSSPCILQTYPTTLQYDENTLVISHTRPGQHLKGILQSFTQTSRLAVNFSKTLVSMHTQPECANEIISIIQCTSLHFRKFTLASHSHQSDSTQMQSYPLWKRAENSSLIEEPSYSTKASA